MIMQCSVAQEKRKRPRNPGPRKLVSLCRLLRHPVTCAHAPAGPVGTKPEKSIIGRVRHGLRLAPLRPRVNPKKASRRGVEERRRAKTPRGDALPSRSCVTFLRDVFA